MEELRSTEILDKEIQEDARRKAERILKTADADAAKIEADVAVRTAAVRKEKEAAYEEHAALYRKDADAALPLEKERFLVSFEDKAVADAIGEYIDALPEEKKLLLVGNLLKRFKSALEGREANLFVNGFSCAAVEALVKKEMGARFVKSCTEISDVQAHERGGSAGFFVETVDGEILCRVTVSEVVASILDIHRQELADTLFGGRLPE